MQEAHLDFYRLMQFQTFGTRKLMSRISNLHKNVAKFESESSKIQTFHISTFRRKQLQLFITLFFNTKIAENENIKFPSEILK